MSRKLKIALLCAAFPVLLVLLGVGRHYWAKSRLETYGQALANKGESLDPATFKSRTLPGAKLLVLAKQLPAGSGTGPLPMQMNGPETAVASSRLPVTNRQDFSDKEDLLGQLQKELANPSPDFVAEEKATNYLAELRKTTRSLSTLALLKMQAGQFAPALTAALQSIDALERFGNEPRVFSQLMRAQLFHADAALAWELIQSREGTESQLAEYQRHWEQTDVLLAWGEACARTRAELQEQMDYVREHQWKKLPPSVQPEGMQNPVSAVAEAKDLVKKVRTNPGAGLQSAFVRYPVFWAWDWWGSYDEQVAQLELLAEIVRAARAFQAGSPYADVIATVTGADAALQARVGAVRAILPPFVKIPETYAAEPGFRRMARAVAVRQLVITALALERFRLRQGNYPEKLEALAPEFLAKPPLDPMDGKPLRYQRLPADGYRLYSIGTDLQDAGGDGTVDEDARMLSNFNGRDILWPQAAGEKAK